MLHKIISNKIINFEYDVDCPLFDKPLSNVYCMHHALKYSDPKYRCALNNIRDLGIAAKNVKTVLRVIRVPKPM